MKEDIKLIALPSKPDICMFIIAAIKNDFSYLSEKAYYLVENSAGSRYFIYARDEEDFYNRWLKN